MERVEFEPMTSAILDCAPIYGKEQQSKENLTAA
jgi:hypothetical protein